MVGTLVRGCRCASWCDLDLTFDFAGVTMTIISCLDYTSECVRCRRLIFRRYIGWGFRCS